MTRKIGAGLALLVVLLGGCGGDDGDDRASDKATALASARAIEQDPNVIACGHIRNQGKWDHVTRQATTALADQQQIKGLNRLQATQSIYYAMTEVCKGRPASYEPAEAALEGVRTGTYRADLGSP